MTRQYNSFLIRCWHLDEHGQRIKIEHIQSGDVAVVATLAAALAWLNTHWSERFDDSSTTQDLVPPADERVTSARQTDQSK